MDLKFHFENESATRQCCQRVVEDSCQFRLSSKYRLYYRFARPIMPIFVRQMLQRDRKIETNDDWYKPTEFINSIPSHNAGDSTKPADLWPDAAKFAFVLTHDVETSVGMKHIARIADKEESLGFRSSWNLVPYKYKIDMGLVKDLQSRGFEIGIHGFNHDGRLYSSRKVFEKRAKGINDAIKKYGAVGFRSPMAHRNLEWLQSLDIAYDSSCFDIDPYQAAPGGVGTIWPFMAGKFVELPYTLPQDHTLFVALGERDDRTWKDKLELIIRHQGMALMLTHPDYLTEKTYSEIYFRFLEHVRDIRDFWHGLPLEVAQWWRKREQAETFAKSHQTSKPKPQGNRNQVGQNQS